METPVSFAPVNIAWEIGEAPFHWGSRDEWIFIAPLTIRETNAPIYLLNYGTTKLRINKIKNKG